MKKSDFYREARRDLSGPLHGVRVLEATTSWAGPMCACVLADLGADVIKIEALSGEVARRLPPFVPGSNPPVSFAQATVNRNKRSMTLDLGRPEGRDLFLKLGARSDIVVENFRPGTMDRWGVGYQAVRAVKPDIIYVSISGFGQFGRDHDRPGYDPIAQAASGFISLNGSADGPPVKAATFLCDDLGGVHGAIGAMAALRHRDRTGEGQHVDIALLDAMLFQSNGYLTLGAMGLELKRMGNEYPFSVPTNVYRCRDGFVMAGTLLDSHWKVLARVIGRPELADDPEFAILGNRITHRAEADAMLAAWAAGRTVGEVVEIFTGEGLAAAPVNTYAQAARDPHVLDRDMLQPVAQEGGTTAPITGPAAKFSRTPTRVRSAAPALGAHTEQILDELGVSVAERRRLRESKII